MKFATPIFCRSVSTSTDPQEAADIANKIVAVYQDKRVEEEKEILNRAVATMNEEVVKAAESKWTKRPLKSLAFATKNTLSILIRKARKTRRRRSTAIVVKQEGEVNDAEAQGRDALVQTASKSRSSKAKT